MGRQSDPQIQIARLRAGRAVFALARNTDARSIAHAGRDPDIHSSRVAVVGNREPTRGAVQRVLEIQFDLLFDVPSLAWCAGASAAPARASLGAGARAAAEKGMEDIRKRI